MHPFVQAVQAVFETHRNDEKAVPMKQYMKNQYPFLGIQTPERKQLLRQVFREYGQPNVEELAKIARDLWMLPEREYAIAALIILEKYHKYINETHIPLLEELITTKSWWDTVDYIAPRLVGTIFAAHPHNIEQYIAKWLNSGNIWLQRTCILFQLKYKNQTDTKLLFSLIEELSSSKEFFIQKSIGWALREYAKTDAQAVWQFVSTHTLAPLSRREAIKHIQDSFSVSYEG